MPFEEKVGVTIMLALLGIGLLFVHTSGRWKFHENQPNSYPAGEPGWISPPNRKASCVGTDRYCDCLHVAPG